MTTRVDLSGAEWHKSSYSNGDGGNCVEVACGLPGLMPVRDSKQVEADSSVLMFPADSWNAFLTGTKNGHI
ncbi:hypothetical protein AN219_22140 [Streptomyces nanshensis]|nr:hypothetical protein AN219_22140 [Streptomyces nanshensis]